MDLRHYMDETTEMASLGKSDQIAEREAGRSLLQGDHEIWLGRTNPAGMLLTIIELLNTLNQPVSRQMRRADSKSKHRPKADPAAANREWTDNCGKRQEPRKSLLTIQRNTKARNAYNSNAEKVLDEIPDLAETQTIEEWANQLLSLILAFLLQLGAGRKALAALAADVEQGPTLDQLEQVDDQPPIVDAAIVALVAAPAAPPRLLTAA
jgi:hypothetical protein